MKIQVKETKAGHVFIIKPETREQQNSASRTMTYVNNRTYKGDSKQYLAFLQQLEKAVYGDDQ